MKVLVTGATGFIGQHIIPLLLARGDDITAVARSVSKAKEFAWSDKVRFVFCDIYTDFMFEDIFDNHDILIHLAWSGLPNYSSLYHFEKNLPQEYVFIKKMVDQGVRNVLVVGTCFEYGMQCGQLSENLLTQPSNPYGYAKDALRQQLQFLQSTAHFNLTWTRLFYLYGEGQSENSLYTSLKASVQRGDKVFNLSGGEQLRDFQTVENVAEHIIQLALAEQNIGVINVCSGEPISVRKLVEQWVIENKWEIVLNFGYYPYSNYEPMAFWGGRERLNSVLAQL